jgi:hypothetical protein
MALVAFKVTVSINQGTTRRPLVFSSLEVNHG